ncbi:ABC transporter substrate-binding protein [Chitinophaga sancti]|uniref:ABC-type Fe3+-hydroxamate transport system, substrate-binding protein n=1 Tax=Chitinophaga sancti TaxID=1004 RepID=A0A1K1SBF8_9BACT|nr:helical backbone metal receptor [Chitinophaga sancti]WQD63528.1 helical backbone metal receptor [Chitinophaga sancti]WQG90846.1 helical backbone metal receptor [Chitinophaga sancti]SFW81562.1 ABC-type Fe3+-hydroxamate transport system, substrate-binding protein [Chitinophaga sancti]
MNNSPDSSYTDQTGREVKLSLPPRRIVSLVPSITELLFDLGLENEIVGVTKFCIHPVNNKTRIGGTKRLHLSAISALQPDLIIANKEENEREQVEALMQEYPVWVSDVHDLSSALEMIRQVAEITDRGQKGRELCTAINAAFAQLAQQIAVLTRGNEKLKVAYYIWKDPWMLAGGDTFISSMLEQCGLENVFKDRTRYPEISPETLMHTDCQLVLLSSEPFPFKESHVSFFKNLEVRLVDGEMFSWYGSRILRAVAYFRDIFYLNQTFF